MQKVLTQKNLYSISIGAVSFVLITLPFKHNVNSVGIILLSVLALIHWIGARDKFKMNITFWGFVFFYLWACLSYFWSDDQQESLKAFRKLLPFLLLPISIQIVNQNFPKWTEKILTYFSLGIILSSLFCLIYAVFEVFKTKSSSHLFYHNLSEPLFGMSAIYMSLFVAFSFFFLYFQQPFKKWQNLCLLGFLLFTLVLLSSKILITATFLIIVFDQLRTRKYYLLILIIPMILILFWKNFSSEQIKQRVLEEIEKTDISEVLTANQFGQVYHWTGSGLRLFQAKCFYELLESDKKYFLGYGFLASQEKLTEKYQEYDLYPGFYTYNFHNQYLQTMADLGIVGLILMVFLIYKGYRKALAEKSPLFFVFILLITLICITESLLWRQWGMVFFVTIYCLLYLQPLQRTGN